uniref:histone acetyltransferase n=1 Tax=Heterorhabditis bacteriophora TaxID=37862 RepID=A0A1I7X7P7_HETBA
MWKVVHFYVQIVDNPPYPKAVFLHVLSTNIPAINFYKSNGFIHHETLLNYYRMDGAYGDGCTYVLYTNGARPPFSFADVCRSVGAALCFPIKALCRVLVYS